MVIREESDKYRRLTMTITAFVHHKDSPDTSIEGFTKTYMEEEDGPFTNIRDQWIYEKIEVIIKMLTNGAIQIFRNYGITAPTGGSQKNTSFNWKYDIISTDFQYEPEEVLVPVVPQDVIDRIERLEGLIMDSKNTIKEYEDMIADILAKKEEERTDSDKEKLLRLDGYVRSENESIRKFESEINRLKKEWNIE